MEILDQNTSQVLEGCVRPHPPYTPPPYLHVIVDAVFDEVIIIMFPGLGGEGGVSCSPALHHMGLSLGWGAHLDGRGWGGRGREGE